MPAPPAVAQCPCTDDAPAIFPEHALDVARACLASGNRHVAVTAGSVRAEPRRELFAHMDAANLDLEAFTDCRRICGGHLEPALETIAHLARETDCWLGLTTLPIPGHKDPGADARTPAGSAPRLCRPCPGRGGRAHLLPGLRRTVDRPRLVPAHPLGARCRCRACGTRIPGSSPGPGSGDHGERW